MYVCIVKTVSFCTTMTQQWFPLLIYNVNKCRHRCCKLHVEIINYTTLLCENVGGRGGRQQCTHRRRAASPYVLHATLMTKQYPLTKWVLLFVTFSSRCHLIMLVLSNNTRYSGKKFHFLGNCFV